MGNYTQQLCGAHESVGVWDRIIIAWKGDVPKMNPILFLIVDIESQNQWWESDEKKRVHLYLLRNSYGLLCNLLVIVGFCYGEYTFVLD